MAPKLETVKKKLEKEGLGFIVNDDVVTIPGREGGIIYRGYLKHEEGRVTEIITDCLYNKCFVGHKIIERILKPYKIPMGYQNTAGEFASERMLF